MSAQEVLRAVQVAIKEERIATGNRLLKQIERTAAAPDNLNEKVSISWLQLLRIFDRDREAKP